MVWASLELRIQCCQIPDETPWQFSERGRCLDDKLPPSRWIVCCPLLSVFAFKFTTSSFSHLPDITIITPVFDSKTKDIIFFTASRGHHADIGGILPGSMPPTSVNIFEEGAEIVSFKIVNDGVFDRDGLIDHMVTKPAQYPSSSGCRNIRDVESDLKAVRNPLEAPESWIKYLSPANCG